MGSYANSNTQSKTNYSNLPITQSGDNPLSLTAAGSDGAQVGGSGNVNGALNASQNLSVARGGNLSLNTTTLDGGAINRAFDFGSNLVGIVADITKQNNANYQAQTAQALQTAAANQMANSQESANTAVDKPTVNDWTQNKTLIYAAVAVAIAYFWVKK